MSDAVTEEGMPDFLVSGKRAYWTAREVASELQVSLRWVEKQVAARTIPFFVLPGGRLVRFDPDAVRAWARSLRR